MGRKSSFLYELEHEQSKSENRIRLSITEIRGEGSTLLTIWDGDLSDSNLVNSDSF